jgi:N-acetylneuraminic acid mutarotase
MSSEPSQPIQKPREARRAAGLSCLLALSAVAGAESVRVDTLPNLPDLLGYAGMFAGVSNGQLLCGGGANFPEIPLAQGGKKVWHSRIFSLEKDGLTWKHVGDLPQPWGYGVSASWKDAVVIAGGSNASRHYTECSLVRYRAGRIYLESLPPLPVALANGTGCVVGDILYIAGGQDGPTATRSVSRFLSLDLSHPERGWNELPWPSGAPSRILAVSASAEGWFYMMSGAELSPNERNEPTRTYLRDAWRYRPGDGWERLPDLPRAAAGAPSPCAVLPSGSLLIHSGVWPEYLASAPAGLEFPGFSREWLILNPRQSTWQRVHEPRVSVPARVTAPAVWWNDYYVVPSGESAPGIRTPTVLALKFLP